MHFFCVPSRKASVFSSLERLISHSESINSMKTNTTLLAAALLLGAICWVVESASGQTGIPVLVGPLNDGMPPPPPLPKPPLDTGPVREVREIQLRHGTASLCRVLSPRQDFIVDASKPVTRRAGTGVFPTDLVAYRHLLLERYRKQRQIFVSAIVYDHHRSYVRWQVNGRMNGDSNRYFAAWSNVDFNHFTGIGGFELSGIRYSFFMPVGNVDSARLKTRMEAAGRQFDPLQTPELPQWEPTFVLVEGDPTDVEGILPVKGLHDLYQTERFRLAAAFQGRERARLARESWLKANPPQPKHHVLYHYAVQPKKNNPPTLARSHQMKYIEYTFFAMVSFTSAFADPPIQVEIVGSPANHRVKWTTQTAYAYRIEASPDLESWIDPGLIFPGTGGVVEHGFMSADDRWFYRIEEAPDTAKVAFLTLPTPGQEVVIDDGVCIAFDLTVFPQFPSKIQIYKRIYQSEASWDLIGSVDDFVELNQVRFARGSVVWVPEALGDYEVRATAVDANGQVIGNATRPVFVIPNSPPVVVIESGPPSPATEEQFSEFTTTVTDPNGDEIRRVEFYDNGVLMGTDDLAPFGDEILDGAGQKVWYLWNGTHLITARAYDSKGDVGPESASYDVTVTCDNSQPHVAPPNTFLYNGILTVYFDASDQDGTADIASVTAKNLGTGDTASAQHPQGSYPTNVIYLLTAGWTPGTHSIAVMVRDKATALSYLGLTEVVIPGAPPDGGPFAMGLAAKIADETTAPVSNVRFTGSEDSSGYFDFGLARGLGLDQGVVLTTGEAISWNTGDISEVTSKQWVLPGDKELYFRVVGRETWDAAVLEFDVFCVNGQLVIDYQFGTEEYDEYVDDYNDAFMISVDGVPVTLVPDCSDIVGVQSVSLTENRHLFLDDEEDIIAKNMVAPGYESTKVEYDGMTIRLRANALVTAGESHHVRIVIADVNDYQLDAALFLGQGVLKTVQPTP